MQEQGRAVRTAGAVSTSVMFHVGLLVVFAAIRWGVMPEASIETVAADFASNETVETVTTLPKLNENSVEEAGGVEAAPLLTESTVNPLPIATVVDAKASPSAEVKQASRETTNVAAKISRGTGRGNSTGNGAGQGGSFFDAAAEGDRVVYVVDCSKSMNRFYPSPERTRFGRVKRELVDSIRKLRPEQRFFVIYFNTVAHPMPAQRMISRNSIEVMDNLRWLAGFQTIGRTNPEPALLMALGLKPDAIFFLTDGDFRANIVDNVLDANAFKTPIHAIGFGDDIQDARSEAIIRLTDLSSGTGGRLTLISDTGTIVRQ